MNETFERQLDRLMGESKAILSPPENPAIEKSNLVVNKIFDVLDAIQSATDQNLLAMSDQEHQNANLKEDFLSTSILNWTSPAASPVKIAQTKKLRQLSVPKKDLNENNQNSAEFSDTYLELEHTRLELQQERETVARLRSQLEKSHARERQLRNQCEDLLSTLDRQKSAYRRHSNTKYDN